MILLQSRLIKSVLVAKIQAILRRTYDFSSAVAVIEHKGAMLNTEDGTLIYNNEKYRLQKRIYNHSLSYEKQRKNNKPRKADAAALGNGQFCR